MFKISVIIPPGPESILTQEWAETELTGMSHEILIENWPIGANRAKGEYVCFLEKDCVLSDDYFINLLELFEDRPLFRKLAVVAPTLCVKNWEQKVYGYHLGEKNITPSFTKSSSEPYLAQIVFLPGALVRASALQGVRVFYKDIMLGSTNLSLGFWDNGQRVMIDPNTLYCSTDEELDLPYPIDLGDLSHTIEMFHQELIG